MIYFVGAGSGAPDLITVRGDRLLRVADVVIWAGSLVNPALLDVCKETCVKYDSATMTLEEVLEVMNAAHSRGDLVVRLHTGDPSLFGAIREQMDALAKLSIPFEIVPGVSSFSAAAASLKAEFTLPEVSQTVILTRLEGRTPVPEKEKLALLASHQATMAIFLSAGMLEKVQAELLEGGYDEKTPAAIVFKASWPDEEVYPCTVGTLAQTGQAHNIRLTALVIVGDVLGDSYERSRLYHPDFPTLFRPVR